MDLGRETFREICITEKKNWYESQVVEWPVYSVQYAQTSLFPPVLVKSTPLRKTRKNRGAWSVNRPHGTARATRSEQQQQRQGKDEHEPAIEVDLREREHA